MKITIENKKENELKNKTKILKKAVCFNSKAQLSLSKLNKVTKCDVHLYKQYIFESIYYLDNYIQKNNITNIEINNPLFFDLSFLKNKYKNLKMTEYHFNFIEENIQVDKSCVPDFEYIKNLFREKKQNDFYDYFFIGFNNNDDDVFNILSELQKNRIEYFLTITEEYTLLEHLKIIYGFNGKPVIVLNNNLTDKDLELLNFLKDVYKDIEIQYIDNKKEILKDIVKRKDSLDCAIYYGDLFYISLTLGYLCNFNCSYCFQNKFRTNLKEKPEDCLKFLKYIDELKKIVNGKDFIILNLLGGETTLYPVKTIIKELFKKIKINQINFLTNGTNCEKVIELDKICKKNNVFFNNIVSIHTQKINLDNLLEYVSIMKNNNVNTLYKTVVTDDNKKEVKKISNALKKIGIKLLEFLEIKYENTFPRKENIITFNLKRFSHNEHIEHCVLHKSGRKMFFTNDCLKYYNTNNMLCFEQFNVISVDIKSGSISKHMSICNGERISPNSLEYKTPDIVKCKKAICGCCYGNILFLEE